MVGFSEFIDACLYFFRNIASVYVRSWNGEEVVEYSENLLILAGGWWVIAIAWVAVLLLALGYDEVSTGDTADAINLYSNLILRDAKSCGCDAVGQESSLLAERVVPRDVGRRLRKQMDTLSYKQHSKP